MSIPLDPRTPLFLLTILLVVNAHFFAWSWGFFSPPDFQRTLFPALTLLHVAAMMLAFLILQAILLPLALALFLQIWQGDLNWSDWLRAENGRVWINGGAVLLSAPLLWKFGCYLEPLFCHALVKRGSSASSWTFACRNFALGASAWLLAFPIAQAIGLAMGFFNDVYLQTPEIDQEAVKIFKLSFDSFRKYWLMVLSITVMVPFIEEFVMRGFLQTWLRQKLSAPWAIIVTSVIFSILHYSSGHGWRNLELMPALFALSCYLGYLFERQHSLWAPIGLHVTFNLVSVVMITYQIAGE